jgi:4-amino-4-deoxy-L-arabinose transferase-like glycosyltransferase
MGTKLKNYRIFAPVIISMQKLTNDKFTKTDKLIILLSLLLLIPALFINLGFLPLLADEGIRALVAIEMIISDNYIVPTINGEFYYNKPPVYNWIIILFYKLTNNYSEFVLRIPSILSLLAFGLTIFLTLKKYVCKKTALISAFLFVISGRIFFYFTLLGHIDMFYSWITYLAFFVVFHYHQKGEYFKLFLFSYLLTSIGFLTKGLPSVVFQGITLLTFFIYQKEFKKLFSWQHIVSFLIFASIVGGYLYAYSQYNDLETYFNTLWSESSKRTVAEKEWYESILHIFTYPFKFMYWLLPSSFMLIFMFRKDVFKIIFSNSILKFAFLIFITNNIVYWLSPETRGRYIFMLIPLATLIFAWFFTHNANQKLNSIFKWLVAIFGIIVLAGLVAAPFYKDTKILNHIWPISIFLILILGLVIFLIIKNKKIVWLFFLMMMIARIAFDLIIIPPRIVNAKERRYKEAGIEIAEITKDAELYIFNNQIKEAMSFYITRERGEIIKVRKKKIPGPYYLIYSFELRDKDSFTILNDLDTVYQNVRLVKFEE